MEADLIGSALKQRVLDYKIVNTCLTQLATQLGMIGNGNSLVVHENTGDRTLELGRKISNKKAPPTILGRSLHKHISQTSWFALIPRQAGTPYVQRTPAVFGS